MKDRRGSNRAAPEIEENRARLIGEIIAEAVAELGADRAMMPDGYVLIGPDRGNELSGPAARGERGTHDGITPENSASL